jgi:hypothetical protein
MAAVTGASRRRNSAAERMVGGFLTAMLSGTIDDDNTARNKELHLSL